MSLHLSTGQPVSAGEFILDQWRIMQNWPPAQSPEKEHSNDAVYAWIHLFAAHVRNLCAKHGIPVDILLSRLAGFQDKIAKDIAVLKWAKSMSERHDVGWESAADLVTSQIEKTRDLTGRRFGSQLTLIFPYVPTSPDASGPDTVRHVYFPLETTAGQAHRHDSHRNKIRMESCPSF